MKKRFWTAAMSMLIFTSSVISGSAAGFSDVSDRYQEAVNDMVNRNISSGVGGGKFGVDMPMKRVDAAVMLAKALNLDTVSAPKTTFTDVPLRAQGAVSALVKAGVVSGKTTSLFGSDQTLTRGELALILTRAFQLTGTAAHSFHDVSPRYQEAVTSLVANGITTGKSSTVFGTADPVKRGEFAIFLYRVQQEENELEVIDIY